MMSDEKPPQAEFDDLEIRVSRSHSQKYRAEIRTPTEDRYSEPLSELPPGLDPLTDPKAYGCTLFEWLFRGQLRDAFRQVRWATESYSQSSSAGVRGVRLRLWLDPEAAELQPVLWESLRDSDATRLEPISLTMAFSRFLNVKSRRRPPVRERPLRMLFVTANPRGLDRFDLENIDVELEKSIVGGAVSPLGSLMQFSKLGSDATIENIRSAEKEGYHITHLLAHGVSRDGEPCLLLSDSAGTATEVPCAAVAKALVSENQPPYLVSLSMPVTGEEHEGNVLLSLARMLVEAGVQAVVAIRAPIDAERLLQFTKRFYGSLIQTGVVDQAIADARVAIYKPGTWEWAYPVLYTPAVVGELYTHEPASFEALLSSIRLTK